MNAFFTVSRVCAWSSNLLTSRPNSSGAFWASAICPYSLAISWFSFLTTADGSPLEAACTISSKLMPSLLRVITAFCISGLFLTMSRNASSASSPACLPRPARALYVGGNSPSAHLAPGLRAAAGKVAVRGGHLAERRLERVDLLLLLDRLADEVAERDGRRGQCRTPRSAEEPDQGAGAGHQLGADRGGGGAGSLAERAQFRAGHLNAGRCTARPVRCQRDVSERLTNTARAVQLGAELNGGDADGVHAATQQPMLVCGVADLLGQVGDGQRIPGQLGASGDGETGRGRGGLTEPAGLLGGPARVEGVRLDHLGDLRPEDVGKLLLELDRPHDRAEQVHAGGDGTDADDQGGQRGQRDGVQHVDDQGQGLQGDRAQRGGGLDELDEQLADLAEEVHDPGSVVED